MAYELPLADSVTRWIRAQYVGKDDDGQVIVDAAGSPLVVAPEAFELTADEVGLSVTWLEHFSSVRAEQLKLASAAVRSSLDSKSISKKSIFAVGNVARIIDCGKAYSIKLRVLHDPDDNPGHSEIRRLPPDLGEIHLALATNVFGERYLAPSILPTE